MGNEQKTVLLAKRGRVVPDATPFLRSLSRLLGGLNAASSSFQLTVPSPHLGHNKYCLGEINNAYDFIGEKHTPQGVIREVNK